MSSNEQEIGTATQDDDKPDTSQKEDDSTQKTTVDSKDVSDSVRKGCGDTVINKAGESIKTSDLDDDDDDEMHLRWEDDDEESNNEASNVKEIVNQTEKDLVFKDTDTLENPSSSLDPAVKELENALTESKIEAVNYEISNVEENVSQTDDALVLKDADTLDNTSTSLVSSVKELEKPFTESNNEEANNETPNVKENVDQIEDALVLKDADTLENPSSSLVSAVQELENALTESNHKKANNETPNVEEPVNQTEVDSVFKDTNILEAQPMSLVSAVEELENALSDSNNEDLDFINKKVKDSDEIEQETEKTGTNSSKEILENIDKLIGTDDATEIIDDQEHSNIQPNKVDVGKVTDDSEISKMDVDTEAECNEQHCSDSINLDDSTGSLGESNILSSTVSDSFIERDVSFKHGLKRPDMMLEIPTQEIIECLDDFDDSDCEKDDEMDESVDISKQMHSLDEDIDSKIMDDEKELSDQQKERISDVIVDTSKQINRSEGDIVSKITEGKELLDQPQESIPDVTTKDVTEVSNNEDLSEHNVDMFKKTDIVLKTDDSVKSLDNENVMENPEKIKEGSTTETLSRPVDSSTINDENKDKSGEDTLMEVDESNIMLKNVENDVNSKNDSESSVVTEIPHTEKINETITIQATKQDIVTPQDQTKDTSVEPKQIITEEDSKNKSETADSTKETDMEISHEKLAVDNITLPESKNSDVTLDSVKKSQTNSELSPIKMTTESKLTQSIVSESLLGSKSDNEPKNSETEKTKAVESILDQADTEISKDAKPTENVATKSISDPSIEQSEENKNIEQISNEPSTSEDLNNASDQIPDTTDEVPVVEDSLGLLAESSRVMDDDEEVEEDEEGDADDDDDFDQDDESSNQMTAEHSEDSSAQPDKDDGQTDKEEKTPTEEEKEFNFAVTSVTTEELAGNMDVTVEETKVLEDVAAEDAPAPIEAAADTESDKELIALEPDIETVNLSDTSDKETEAATNSILKELLSKKGVPPSLDNKVSETVVELEGSSSEDDVQEVNKAKEKEASTDVKKDETKLTPEKDVKSEAADSEKKETGPKDKDKVKTEPIKPDAAMEVFNLDSDDDVPMVADEVTIIGKPESNKCINPCCPSGARAVYVTADVAARAYYDAHKKRKYRVCVYCAEAVAERTKGLVNGIKELTPLLQLDLRKVSSETVEISDSDSDDGEGDVKPEVLGENGVKFLEENLAEVINETWIKYKLNERLTDAQSELDKELQKLEAESKEIDTMLNECQVATDLLRNQLYATFEPERRELSAICIFDTPLEKYSFCENASGSAALERNLKRRTSTIAEQPAKRPAIPLGYTPLDDVSKAAKIDTGNDDDKDVSVVKLSAEAAPSDLPPPGEITRPRLSQGMSVFAMRNSFCTWVPGKIVDVHPKNPANAFTMCRVRFEIRQKIATRVLSARCLAYFDPADVRLTIGTRVIALSKENVKANEPNKNKKSFYSGIVAEIPNPVNNYRYLIFFDHGYAQYVHHRDTRVVCESSTLVWEEVHPNSREFVKQYLIAYPERPMVRLHAGQKLKTEWNGKWWVTKVLQVDASLVEIEFEDNRTEWVYRGSTRLAPLFLELQAAERQRARPLPRSNQRRMNMPYVEYTRSEEQNKAEALQAEQARQQQQQQEEMRRQRAVAKKSTALPAPMSHHPSQGNLDSVTSRVVYYTPKNAVKPYKMVAHVCSPKCKRTDVLALKDLRTYNPLAKPLLSGWERQIVRFKGHKEVMYRAPCGRRVRSLPELHRYLRAVQSDMAIDLFDFGVNTHCLAEFVLNKCLVGKKDLSHGKENVPVPCVNYYDESLPEFCSYNTERTPTAGVPLNLDPEFLCGCDCTDDCQDKTKCACWKLTLEGARTIGLDDNVGYEYKRLPEPLPSGIYECNSRCKCKHTCLNRVAQHPLQLKLQVFKTLNRGWGIRALNDVPKGAFLCVYAGNLLTDATANLDGLNEGDEYLAELDYIEVVEQMKEGYEEDIPQEDKKLDRKASESSEEESSSEEEETNEKDDKEDDDFQPGFIGLGVQEFSKRLRKRDRTRKKGEEKEKEKGKEIDKGMEDDGCITISDDEEAKEPTRFMAESGIGAKEFVSKYKSVRALYGKDEACYIMDAKVQGNIGRYLNHSCTPNVFVQNVFVDSHDPRFPWVAFFALSHIRAGTELTWNYNYDVGSVPGKVLYCYCGAPNCRGRLL